MRRRNGRPGLIGTMARTAVIAGTATAVSGSVQSAQHQKAAAAQSAAEQRAAEQQAAADSQAQIAALQAQVGALQPPAAAPPEAPAAPAPAGGNDLLAQLERLAALKSAGVLDDAEFSAAKARLLAG